MRYVCRGFQTGASGDKRLQHVSEFAPAFESTEALHFEIRRLDYDLNDARLGFAAIEVGRNQLRRDQVVCLHLFVGEIPLTLHRRRQPAVLLEHELLPLALVHFHPLRNLRDAHIVLRLSGHVDDFIRR